VTRSGIQRMAGVAALIAGLAVPLGASPAAANAAQPAAGSAILSGQTGVAGLPLAKDWVSDGTVSTLQEVREELSLRCMAKLGFRSVSAQYGEVANSGTSTLALPAVERTGAGLAQYDPAANSLGHTLLVAHSAVPLVSRPPSAAQDTAMYGRGKKAAVSGGGGCWGQAGRILYGSHPALPEDPRAVAIASQSYAMQAPATRAAASRWTACMRRAGEHYASPLAAASDVRWGSARNLAAESRTAYADVACRSASGLTRSIITAEVRYQQHQLAVHGAAIRQSLRDVAGWLRNARAARVSLAAPRAASALTSRVASTPAGVGGLTYFTGPVTYTNLSYTQRLDLWHSNVTDGNKVDIYKINGGNAQNWIYSNTLTNGCRVLAPNANENYAVQDPSGSLAYNEPASIWSIDIGAENIDNWKTVSIASASGYPSGYYVIQDCTDWLYLNPYNGGSGAQLVWSVAGAGFEGGDEVWY
jgi:hypothetical protein